VLPEFHRKTGGFSLINLINLSAKMTRRQSMMRAMTLNLV
jgi:hypothetical protein